MIEQYYQSLLDFLAACAIVQSFELGLDKRSSVLAFVRGDVYFTDDSRLHFRELVDTHQLPVRDMYAYHYQSADGGLLFRYDNTPHYPDLPKLSTSQAYGERAQGHSEQSTGPFLSHTRD